MSGTSGVLEVNGARLSYDVQGSGQPLILLHGGSLDRRMWDQQVDALAERFMVVRYDLRGHGRSDLGHKPYSHADDLAEILRLLGIDHAALLGLSLGSVVALDFALQHAERVDALVLASAGLPGEVPEDDGTLARWMPELVTAIETGDRERWKEVFLRLWVDGRAGPVSSSVRRRVLTMLDEHSLAAFSPAAPEQQGLEPAVNRLAEITAPTRIIVGERDQHAVLVTAKRLEAEIGSAQRVIVENAAHMVNMEQPDEFNRIVLDFLQRSVRP